MFATNDEPFFVDNELEYNVFEIDDLCSVADSMIAYASKSDSPRASLELKPLLDSRNQWISACDYYFWLRPGPRGKIDCHT